MGMYDKEEITHIFDDTVEYLTCYDRQDWWFFKWGYLT